MVLLEQINEESKITKYEQYNDKVFFDALLQEFEVKNKNKRIYPTKLMKEAYEMQMLPKAANRSFVGELDHPLDSDMNRKVTIEFKNVSHIFTKLWLNGNKLFGHGETLMTSSGKNMAALIRDNIPVGFSLRAWGQVQQNGDTLYVKEPIHIICYDCVQNPSYEMARVTNITQENFNQMLDNINSKNTCMALVENEGIIDDNKLMFDYDILNENENLKNMYKTYLNNKISNFIDNKFKL